MSVFLAEGRVCPSFGAHGAAMAVLDRDGVITAVTAEWARAERDSGWGPDGCGPGTDYLRACEQLSQDAVAAAVGAAVRAALAGGHLVATCPAVPDHSPVTGVPHLPLVASRFDDAGGCLGATVVLLAPAEGVPAEPASPGPPPAEVPVAEVPDAEVPVAEVPVAEVPVAELPVAHPRARATAALDLVSDGVFDIDPLTLRIRQVNRAACRMLGFRAHELIGMPVRHLRPEVSDAERRARMAAMVTRPGVAHHRSAHRLRRKDGSLLDCESHVAIVDDDGRPSVLYVFRDLGERLELLEGLHLGEATLRTAFEQAPVGVELLQLQPDGSRTILRANQALAEMVGVPVEALTGRNLEPFTDPSDRQRHAAAMARLAADTHARLSALCHYRRADGSRLWVEVRGRRVEQAGAAGPLAVVHLVDVTARVRAQQRVDLSEHSLRTIFEQAPVGALIARVGPDGRHTVLRANPALGQLLAEPPEALVGADLSRYLDPQEHATLLERLRQVASRRSPEYSGVHRLRGSDGTVRWVDLRIVPVALPGEPGAADPLVLAHLLDVTERHRASQRRSRATAVHRFIARVVTDVLAGQELAVTYRQVVEGVARVFRADDVALDLLDPATGGHRFVALVGPRARVLAAGQPDLLAEFTRWLTAHTTGAGASREGPGRWWGGGPGTPVAVPFAVPGRELPGYLVAHRAPGAEPFTPAEVALLGTLAQQVTLAVRLGQDHSEQRRLAATRDHYLTRLEEAIRPLSDPAAIQRTACRVIAGQLGGVRAVHAEIDGDRRAVVRAQHRADGVPGAELGDIDLADVPAATEQLRRAWPLVVDDVSADRRFSATERAVHREAAAVASIVVPLVKRGRWIAGFAVLSPTPRRWDDLGIQLVRDTAERTWAAVERAVAERASAQERSRRLLAERELLQRTAREQRELWEQEFITNAAHELRTPLTSILGAVDALEAGAQDEPEPRHRFLTHLRHAATRLNRLTDSLLVLAQARSRQGLPSETFPVHRLLADVAAMLQVADGVTVRVEAAAELVLHANRGLAEVLVGNLAGNAARYTVAGSVVLCGHGHGEAVVVEVRDTGPGMDGPTLQRARDRFHRCGATGRDQGFGLGLSIADQAALALGAQLQLESAPGEGTLARVTFSPSPAPVRIVR